MRIPAVEPPAGKEVTTVNARTYDAQASRVARADARTHAQHATLVWQDEVLSALSTLATAALGGPGPDQVVLFDALVHERDDDDDGPFRDELTSVLLVSDQGRVALGRAAGPSWAWAEAVDLWDDLRQVLSSRFQTPLPGGLLVDLSARAVYAWEPFYCPDQGNDPDLALDLARSSEEAADPFTALLDGPSADTDTLVERYEQLMGRYALTAPTMPGHEAGHCYGDDDCAGEDDPT